MYSRAEIVELRLRAQRIRAWSVLARFPREYECRPFGWVVVTKGFTGRNEIVAQQTRPVPIRWSYKYLDSLLPRVVG